MNENNNTALALTYAKKQLSALEQNKQEIDHVTSQWVWASFTTEQVKEANKYLAEVSSDYTEQHNQITTTINNLIAQQPNDNQVISSLGKNERIVKETVWKREDVNNDSQKVVYLFPPISPFGWGIILLAGFMIMISIIVNSFPPLVGP